MTNKEQFLMEHNKSSPQNLQATLLLLNNFKEEKKSLFKNDNWSIDKLRRPFIIWLIALQLEKDKLNPLSLKDSIKQAKKITTDKKGQLFHIYPYDEA